MSGKLTPNKIREYISDYPDTNLLLDKEEFSDTYIELCMDLALSEYNTMTPRTNYNLDIFPSMSLLLLGTVWQMYLGRSTMMARNQLSYTDGGLQIPVEEKYELYANIANSFGNLFRETASKLKVNLNIEGGWGEVRSDESTFPLF